MRVTQRAPESDSPTFEEFYRRSWQGAARLAAALTNDAGVGEEIAQDAFARLSSRYQVLDNPGGYLRTTVVNLTREWHRATGRRQRRESRAAAGESTSPEHNHLLDVVARLSSDQRTALVLRYWADWDEGAIAEQLGCRPTTVRSHIARALARLRLEIPK